MGDIKIHCESLAENTQKVVLQAKEIAIEAKHKETTKDITNCTNSITDSIEKLIEAFLILFQNFNDNNGKKKFAEASKDVGMAINQLIIAADTAASRKVIEACNTAKEQQQNVLRNISGSQEQLMNICREFGQNSLFAVSKGSSAAIHSADSSKSSLLSHSCGQIKESMKDFIKIAHTVQQDPSNSENKNELAAQYKGLNRIFSDMIDAANIKPDFSDNINDAFSRFNKMLDLAKAVREATSALYDGVLNGISLEDFQRMAKAALQTTMDLIAQAQKVLDAEKDPIRREQIQNSIDGTKASIAELIKTAKELQSNPNDPKLRKELENKKKLNDDEVAKLLALTSKKMEEEKLWYTAKWLEDVCNTLMRDAPNLSSQDLEYYANRVAAITERVAKDAKALAMVTNDPIKREKILNSVSDLSKAGDRYIGDIKNLSRNPGDPQLLKRLGITHEMFGNQIHKVLVAAGLEKEREDTGINLNDGDSDLLRAAKEQARLALQMIKDALEMAEQIQDPVLKQKLIDAAERLKKYAANVIHYAQLAADDPNNLDKQIQLDEAQRLLADGIREVIMLTSSVASDLKELLDSMANDDDVDIAELFALAERLIKELTDFVNSVESTPAKDVVMKAKELANLTNQLSSKLKKVADQTPDARYKEQLTGLARFMRDRATQVKMIAAVKVACGGDAGQVSSAADGLKTTISESVSTLKASELKRRRTRMAGRAAQIQKVIEMWKKCKQY